MQGSKILHTVHLHGAHCSSPLSCLGDTTSRYSGPDHPVFSTKASDGMNEDVCYFSVSASNHLTRKSLCFHPTLLIIDWPNLLYACLFFCMRYDLHDPGKSWMQQLIDQNICVFILNLFLYMSCFLPVFSFNCRLSICHDSLLKPFQWTGSKYYHPSKTKSRLKTPEAGLKGGATQTK